MCSDGLPVVKGERSVPTNLRTSPQPALAGLVHLCPESHLRGGTIPSGKLLVSHYVVAF